MAKDKSPKTTATVHDDAAACVRACVGDLKPFVVKDADGEYHVSAESLHDARVAWLEHCGIKIRAMKQAEQLDALKAAVSK